VTGDSYDAKTTFDENCEEHFTKKKPVLKTFTFLLCVTFIVHDHRTLNHCIMDKYMCVNDTKI